MSLVTRSNDAEESTESEESIESEESMVSEESMESEESIESESEATEPPTLAQTVKKLRMTTRKKNSTTSLAAAIQAKAHRDTIGAEPRTLKTTKDKESDNKENIVKGVKVLLPNRVGRKDDSQKKLAARRKVGKDNKTYKMHCPYPVSDFTISAIDNVIQQVQDGYKVDFFLVLNGSRPLSGT